MPGAAELDVAQVRDDFPILGLEVAGKPLVYLDNAASSQMPQPVIDRLVRYLRTWSAVKRYEKATGKDPLDEVRADLEAAWGDPARERTLRWPIFLRAARL